MIKYYKNDVRFNTQSGVLTIYNSSKHHPHCNHSRHINDVKIDQIMHLNVDDIVELMSHTTGGGIDFKQTAKHQAKHREVESKRAIYYELAEEWQWRDKNDTRNFCKFVEQEHYNQYRLLFCRK